MALAKLLAVRSEYVIFQINFATAQLIEGFPLPFQVH